MPGSRSERTARRTRGHACHPVTGRGRLQRRPLSRALVRASLERSRFRSLVGRWPVQPVLLFARCRPRARRAARQIRAQDSHRTEHRRSRSPTLRRTDVRFARRSSWVRTVVGNLYGAPTHNVRPVTTRHIRTLAPHTGPSVTRDNPCRRCKDGDHRWLRRGRALDADAPSEPCGAGVTVCWLGSCYRM